MIFNLNGNRALLSGANTQVNEGALVFIVAGTMFPQSNYTPESNLGAFQSTNVTWFTNSTAASTITINYGDGNIITYNLIAGVARFNSSIPDGGNVNGVDFLPCHTYTDGYTGKRNITITFSKPDSVTALTSSYMTFYDAFPINIDKLSSISYLAINESLLTSFPITIGNLSKLQTLSLSSIGTAISNRIPPGFLNLKLTRFSISGSTNLSDVYASNFVNFCNSESRDTLAYLFIDYCMMSVMPDEITNFTALKYFAFGSDNRFTTMPSQINSMPSLETLNPGAYIGSNLYLTTWSSVSNLVNLSSLYISYTPNMTTDLPPGIENCVNLKNYNAGHTYMTIARINSFIDTFYSFIITNAAISGDNTLQFRGMTLDCSGVVADGTYQQPSGYVTGSSNGTPASQQEQMWVLVNQYGHTINKS